MDCGTSQSGRWKIKVLANDPIGSYSHLRAQLALQLHCSPSEARLLQASDSLENKILIRCSFTDKTKHVTVFRFKKKNLQTLITEFRYTFISWFLTKCKWQIGQMAPNACYLLQCLLGRCQRLWNMSVSSLWLYFRKTSNRKGLTEIKFWDFSQPEAW